MITRKPCYGLYLLLLLLHLFASKSFAQRAVADSLLKVVAGHPADTAYPALYFKLSRAYMRTSGDTAVLYANLSIEHAKKHKNLKAESEAYGILGTIEKNHGNYEKALAWQLKAMDIKEAAKDETGLATTYNDIGIVYKKMKRWDEALAYYRKSNVLALKYNIGPAIANTYNNIGTIYIEKKEWDSVMANFNLALAAAEKLNNTQIMATVLANIGDCYFNRGQFTEALDIFKRCLQYDKLNEDVYGMASSYFHIANVFEAQQKYDDAVTYIDSADKLAQREQLRRERIDFTYIWATIEEKRHNYARALELQRLSMSIKDSIINEDTQGQLSELQTKYETAKKENEITLQKTELVKKNYIIAGIIGLLLLGSLLGFSSYRRYRLQQQTKLQQAVLKQQELATQAVIEAEENERKRIAGDLHDGVGQLMSAARMNLSVMSHELHFPTEEQKIAFDKALALVDESCKEVRTVSHNIMPNALLKSGLASAIREFIDKIDARILKVNLFAEGINERLPSNIETVLYRVIQECINNVIKHSGANHLDISIIKDEDGISVTIEDNGKGFNTADQSKFDGIGLKNIQTRVAYLKGTVEWDSAIGKGTVVIVHVPNA